MKHRNSTVFQAAPAYIQAETPDREARIQERIPKVEANAEALHARLVQVGFDLPALSRSAMALTTENMSARSKHRKLYALVDAAIEPCQPLLPCREGCAHCCHIAVTISSVEAEEIGRLVGRSPVSFKEDGDLDYAHFHGVPCPFLRQDICSIYDHRPLACRSHVALDEDNLLCSATPLGRADVGVASLDMTVVKLAFMGMNQGRHIGDIREFFPPLTLPEGDANANS